MTFISHSKMEFVKKPVEAIQCANVFSLLQRKMYNVLLANAFGNLVSQAKHCIPIGFLCKQMGYVSHDYKTIKDQFRALRRMDIEWDVINENGNRVWTNTSPLSFARVIEGEGLCEYEFTPSLIPHLIRPAQYALLNLATQAKFKSLYGLILYENCERYKKIGKTKNFDIEQFRALMGISQTQYKEFFSLKNRVIAPAIKEVNKHAGFEVSTYYQKQGKKICKIQFSIKAKCAEISTSSLVTSQNSLDSLKYELDNYFGVSEKEADNWLSEYSFEYISEKVNLVKNSESFKNGAIKSLASYLRSCIKGDFKPAKTSKEAMLGLHNAKLLEENIKSELLRKRHESEIQYRDYVANSILSNFNNVKNELREQVIGEFKSDLQNKFCYKICAKENFNGGTTKSMLEDFIYKHYPDLIPAVLSFDEYIEKNFSQQNQEALNASRN